MKNKILLLGVLLSFIGCADYLDLVPEDDIISTDFIFEKKKDALQFLNGAYQGVALGTGDIRYDPALCGGDEYMTGAYMRTKSYSLHSEFYIHSLKIAEGLQNPSSPVLGIWGNRPADYATRLSNRYRSIRDCNTFISRVDSVYNMNDLEKKEYKAEAKVAKAWYYFELIKHYGPIVLVPENISVANDVSAMQTPRSHVDTCFNRIVRLLDEAIPHLRILSDQMPTRLGTFTKESAYALKAKALLYQASPLFNGNPWYSSFTNKDGEKLFSSEFDNNKWLKAAQAADEAIQFCESVGKILYAETDDEKSDLLNTIRDIQYSVIPAEFNSSELLFGIWNEDDQKREFSMKLPRYNSQHDEYRNEIHGDLTPSMRMVELYYTENGIPLEHDKNWNYADRYKMGIEENPNYESVVALNEPVLNLHLKREPRFYANIAADKCYWKRGEATPEKDPFVLMKPYKGDDHGNMRDRVISGEYQNLTGYWVKKFVPSNVMGGRSMDLSKIFPFPALRLADLYLMKAEAWNEYEGPSAKVFEALNRVRQRAGIPDIEYAWDNFAKNPGVIRNKAGLRDVIQQERMIEFAFEGHRFWDLRRWKKAHEYMNMPIKGWFVFGEDSQSFYNNYNGPLVVWSKNKFLAPRDYFWPLKDEEVLISTVKQNLDW